MLSNDMALYKPPLSFTFEFPSMGVTLTLTKKEKEIYHPNKNELKQWLMRRLINVFEQMVKR